MSGNKLTHEQVRQIIYPHMAEITESSMDLNYSLTELQTSIRGIVEKCPEDIAKTIIDLASAIDAYRDITIRMSKLEGMFNGEDDG